MKVEVNTMIDIEDKEIGIVFIPTIVLDKNRHFTCIDIGFLCFVITITL
mgnify:CR=1 FL=1